MEKGDLKIFHFEKEGSRFFMNHEMFRIKMVIDGICVIDSNLLFLLHSCISSENITEIADYP